MVLLEKVGLAHLEATLAAEEVTVKDLRNMVEEDSEKLGIVKLVHRRRIIAAVKEYSNQKETKECVSKWNELLKKECVPKKETG